AEAILLLAAHLLDVRERLPAEVLLRQLEAETLGERAQVRHRALRDDVVEVDADPHAALPSPSSTRVSASRQSPRASRIDARTWRWPCWAFGNTERIARRCASPRSRPMTMRSSGPRTRTSVAPALAARTFTSTP